MPTFVEHVLSHVQARAAIDVAALASSLTAIVDRARTAHPQVELADERFAAHLGKILASEGVAVLPRLRTDDLYLAAACAAGDPVALATLDRDCIARLGTWLSHLKPTADLLDEVKQRTRERLLAPRTGAPRILDYRGKGELSRFVAAAAVRLAIDILRAPRHAVAESEDLLLERAAPVADPELEHMKRSYAAEFRAAVREALLALPAPARLALRLYYVDGLTLDELAALEHVVASTISRRLASARRSVLEHTRKSLRERLSVDERELESILQLLGSRLELSQTALRSES